MINQNTPDGPTDLEILAGGAKLALTRKDKSTTDALVLDVPFDQIGALSNFWCRNPAEEVKIYLGPTWKDADIAMLDKSSLLAVLEEGRRLNRPTMQRFFEAQRYGQKIYLADADLEKMVKAAAQTG